MEIKYLLIATLSGISFDDQEVWSNQWNVGIADNLDSCYTECELDMKQTIKDSFESQFEDEEDGETKLNNLVETLFTQKEKCHKTEKDLIPLVPTVLYSIQYEPDDYSRIEVNYLLIRLN